MVTDPQPAGAAQAWPKYAFLDDPEIRSLNAFICELTAMRELHDALRLVSEEVRALSGARFVAVVIFEDEDELAPALAEPAALAIPLIVGGRHVGQITAYFDHVRDLAYEQARALEVVAAVAAVTIDNARRLQRDRKRLAQAEVVNAVAPRIAVAQTREELARLAVAALRDKLHYDAARVLWHGEGDTLVPLAATPDPDLWPKGGLSWRDGGAARRVFRDGEPLLVSDRGKKQDAEDIGAGPGLRSLLAVPILGGSGPLGVIEAGARSPRAFDPADLTTLVDLARQVAAVGERVAPEVKGGSPEPARAELLSLVAHDLRGSLSVIKGYATTMLRLGVGAECEKGKRFLNGIDDAADRMTEVLDHVAGVSRLESGRFRPKLRQLDLAHLATETVERLRPQLGEHPVSLELPGEVLSVSVDADHLGRAIGSMLVMAGHVSPEGARLSVRVSRQRGSIMEGWPARLDKRMDGGADHGVVTIRAEGAQLTEEDLRRVFDRMHRLAGGSRSAKKRTGLELYAAKKIIEAHNGQVWAESEPGRGAVLGCVLPLSSPDEAERR